MEVPCLRPARNEGDDIADEVYRQVLKGQTSPPPSALTEGARALVWPVWARDGLSTADRRLLTLACVGTVGATSPIDVHVYTALANDELSVLELQELVLHLAVHCGWPRASAVQNALQAQWARLQDELGTGAEWPGRPEARFTPPAEARQLGEAMFEEVNGFPGDVATTTPFVELGVMGYVYGNVWRRPGLTRRQRRIISIGCDGASGALVSLRTHIRAALESGDLTKVEMDELILHFAIYNGFTNASTMHTIAEALWAQLDPDAT